MQTHLVNQLKVNLVDMNESSLMDNSNLSFCIYYPHNSGDATAREPNDSVASRLPSEQSSKSERDDPDLDAEMDSEGPSEREEEEESEEGEEDEEGDEEEEDDEQGRKATAGKVPVRRRRKIREKRRQEEEEKEEEEEEVPTK